jgi:hypothetical protein
MQLLVVICIDLLPAFRLRQWYLDMFNLGRKYGTVDRIDYLKDVFFPDPKQSPARYCKLTELPYYEV